MFNYITDARQCQRVAGIFTICTLKSRKSEAIFFSLDYERILRNFMSFGKTKVEKTNVF